MNALLLLALAGCDGVQVQFAPRSGCSQGYSSPQVFEQRFTIQQRVRVQLEAPVLFAEPAYVPHCSRSFDSFNVRSGCASSFDSRSGCSSSFGRSRGGDCGADRRGGRSRRGNGSLSIEAQGRGKIRARIR